MARRLRILYAAGPGNVIGTYEHWREGRDDPSQVSMTYSGQFYDVCRQLGAEAYVIPSFSEQRRFTDGQFRFENRPVPGSGTRGVAYHLGQLWWGLRLIVSAIRFRADAVIVSTGTHWFTLRCLPSMGIHVVPSLHSMLRSKDHRPSKVQRLIKQLDQPLFARSCTAIMSASEDISEQVRSLCTQGSRPIVSFLPTYRPEMFDQVVPPDHEKRPFRVMYAGRIVREKGVFELPKIARRFLDTGIDDIEWDVCGSGDDLEELKQAGETAGVGCVFHCHGHLERPMMADMFSRSHVVVVPTMAYCVEGFNQVVVEGALVGRPVVTSSVCPAIRYVSDAVVEVPPDDTRAYGDAILKLYEDKGFYREKHQGSLKVRGNFFDPRCGWGAALTHILTAIEQGRSPEPVSWLDAGTT